MLFVRNWLSEVMTVKDKTFNSALMHFGEAITWWSANRSRKRCTTFSTPDSDQRPLSKISKTEPLGEKQQVKKNSFEERKWISVLMWCSCRHWLWILPLVVVTEQETGERASSVRPQLMETPKISESDNIWREDGESFTLSQAEGITSSWKEKRL